MSNGARWGGIPGGTHGKHGQLMGEGGRIELMNFHHCKDGLLETAVTIDAPARQTLLFIACRYYLVYTFNIFIGNSNLKYKVLISLNLCCSLRRLKVNSHSVDI